VIGRNFFRELLRSVIPILSGGERDYPVNKRKKDQRKKGSHKKRRKKKRKEEYLAQRQNI